MQKKWLSAVMLAALAAAGGAALQRQERESLLPPGEWTLVFHDDFTGT